MSVKQFIIAFLLISSTCVSSWLALQSLNAENSVSSTQSHQPDSIMTDIIVTRMNSEDGKPRDKMQAPLVVHYSDGDIADITNPHFIIFQATGEPWLLSANHGQTQNGLNVLQLWDNVVLQEPAGPQNKPTTITTSALTIYPRQRYAQTQEAVNAQQPGSTVHAVGMHLDMNTGVVNLLSQVEGDYQANQK